MKPDPRQILLNLLNERLGDWWYTVELREQDDPLTGDLLLTARLRRNHR